MINQSDEIKARLDIVDIIRQYMPLKAAGGNFTGRCPFHNEKTPSFTVSPTKQVWYCFGCGRGGDLFSFIMEIEKLTFPEAMRLLAPKAGIVLRQATGPAASERNRILDLLDQAAVYYHRFLLERPEAQSARDYLAKRELSEETWKSWEIGYAPDSWDDVVTYLKGKKFSEKDIVAAGLAVRKPETGRVYNRFRGRIMFPICEVNGNVIGFTGRILPEFESRDQQGKYINSPQTAVYDKSNVLFGLDKARQSIREHDLAILVEGQMDCVTAHQAGFNNVIASSGTALTPEHVLLLKRSTNRIAFAFDSDRAGRQALDRGSEQALASEMETLIIDIPEGKDPDEAIRRNPQGWKDAVASARPVMEYYVAEVLESLDLSQVSNRRAAATSLLPRISRIANNIERDFWLKKLTQAIDMDESLLREMLDKIALPPLATATDLRQDERVTPPSIIGREELLSEQLVALLLRFPGFIESVSTRLSIDQLVGSSNQALYKLLVIYYNKNIASSPDTADSARQNLDYKALRHWLIDYGQAQASDIQNLDRLALLVEKNFFETTFEQAEAIITSAIKELRQYYLTRRLKVVTRLIAELETRPTRLPEEESRLTELLNEFTSLAEEIRQLSA